MMSILSQGRFNTGISFSRYGHWRTGRTPYATSRSRFLCPVPTGVVVGPLSATLFFAMFLMVLIRKQGAVLLKHPNPISSYSHLISTPLASITSRTASQISGPVPSPGKHRDYMLCHQRTSPRHQGVTIRSPLPRTSSCKGDSTA